MRVRDGADAEARLAMRLVIRPRPEPPEPDAPVPPPEEPPIFGPELPPVDEPPPLPPMIEAPFENSLGMRFVESGTPDVLMSVWLTRVRDFRAFVEATRHDATKEVNSILMGGEPKVGFHGHHWADPGFSQGDDSPVCGISWDDAKAFCKWLSETDLEKGMIPAGFEYRLPYAAEWKRALALQAVGGQPPVYPWGNQWPPPVELAARYNLAGQELNDGEMPASWVHLEGFRDAFHRTSPVDTFPPNRLGIKDLVGNLSQYAEDAAGPDNPSRQILGASWCVTTRKSLDLAESNFRLPGYRAVDSGFRCVLARK
jgi:formylglycine-generating enzyme required for sulfatase activity